MQLTRTVIALATATAACGAPADAPPDAAPPDAAIDAAPPDAEPDAMEIDATPFCFYEERDDEYAPPIVKTGDNGYELSVVMTVPGPPPRGNSAWTVQVRDPDGAPVDDLDVRTYPYMPDHGHGTSPTPVATGTTDGTYEITPVNLYMPGYWTVRIGVRDPAAPDVELDHVVYGVCVEP